MPLDATLSYNDNNPSGPTPVLLWTPDATTKGNIGIDIGESPINLLNQNKYHSLQGETNALMVDLDFQHMLSSVSVEILNTNIGVTIRIYEARLLNLCRRGVLTGQISGSPGTIAWLWGDVEMPTTIYHCTKQACRYSGFFDTGPRCLFRYF